MRTLKTEYFYTTCDRWCSIDNENNLHKIIYEGKDCFFDGYLLTDNRGYKIKDYYETSRIHKKGDKFKLLSVISVGYGNKNYLGKNIKTGDLVTFSEYQITFNRNENEKSI